MTVVGVGFVGSFPGAAATSQRRHREVRDNREGVAMTAFMQRAR